MIEMEYARNILVTEWNTMPFYRQIGGRATLKQLKETLE